MRRLALGALAGALLAGTLAYLVLPRGPVASPFHLGAAELRPPAQLATIADTAALHPIVIRDGRAVLGSGLEGTAAQPSRPAPPARLSIPALGVAARIDPVSATRNSIEVPAVGRAGWFAAGPRPGEPGRAVLIGHLDAANGPGLFALLPGVENGTRVAITDARGAVHRFAVVGRAEVDKDSFPAQAVYGPSSNPVLVLITCGGPYTPGVGYRDNVLVYARAV